MKFLRISFYILSVVLFPISSYAELTGHVVYKHPYNHDEIWFTDITDTRNARLLFKHTNVIQDLSVQKNGRYIAIVSRNENNPLKSDTYLVDTIQGHATLIQDRFKDPSVIDISHDGNIIFTNIKGGVKIRIRVNNNQEKDVNNQEDGIFLIRRDMIGKQNPVITLLKETGRGNRIDWAPNGKQIVHSSSAGLFIIDIATRDETRISRKGQHPAFSPDGKKIAFSYVDGATGNPQIDIISLDTLQPLITIKDLMVHASLQGLRWSPDGKYLIYTVFVIHLFEKRTSYRNIAIPVDGGHPVRLLDITNRGVFLFDWIDTAYPVEPKNHLTTLWGKIKQ